MHLHQLARESDIPLEKLEAMWEQFKMEDLGTFKAFCGVIKAQSTAFRNAIKQCEDNGDKELSERYELVNESGDVK